MVFRGNIFDENSSVEEIAEKFLEPSQNLRYEYPNLEVLPKEERKAIWVGAVFKIVDDIELDMDRNLSRVVLNVIIKRIASAIALALRENNIVDDTFVIELGFKLLEDKIAMYSNKFKLFRLTREQYAAKYIKDKQLYNNFTIRAYLEV